MIVLMESAPPEFSEETSTWLQGSDLATRQALGQFMTPRFLRTYLLSQLKIPAGSRVLDPAVGTGEFLRQALDTFPGISVSGWDVDEEILKVARNLVPEGLFSARSGLDDYSGEKFDFVIGNPPYFEMKLDSEVKGKFRQVLNGRANIYGLFFQVGIDALEVGGTLAYVVPPSMNAGAYFKNLRKFLITDNHVLSLKVFKQSNHFVDAQTAVQVIVIRKGPGVSKHTFSAGEAGSGKQSLIFCEDPAFFANIFKSSRSLYSLGYEAVTGSTVWNQHKERLSNDDFGGSAVPLLYARNIKGGDIQLSPDARRPQFILGGRSMRGPAIVVNRIIGSVGKGTISTALVPDGYEFAAENHLNVIRPVEGRPQLVSFSELLGLVSDPDTAVKARALTGNTQLSATEWTHLIPFHA